MTPAGPAALGRGDHHARPLVVVAFATRNGGTAEIADWIGAELAAEGVDAQVRPAPAVADISAARAVVLGSGLYGGRWLREAGRFARRHRDALLSVPVWLFSSGPLDASAAWRDTPPPAGVRRIADRIDAVEHVTFGGRLVAGTHGLVARMILSRGRGGDYRNRGRVDAWAREIATQVNAAEGPPT